MFQSLASSRQTHRGQNQNLQEKGKDFKRAIIELSKAKSRMPDLDRPKGIDNEDLLVNSVLGTFESLANHSPREISFERHENYTNFRISSPPKKI